MLLIFLHYQHSFPQLAFPEKPRQQATFTPHPAKGTPECTEVSKVWYSAATAEAEPLYQGESNGWHKRQSICFISGTSVTRRDPDSGIINPDP